MSDHVADDVTFSNGSPPLWKRSVKILGWLLAAWMVARMAWLLRPGDVRSRIEIGPETTVVTGPLAPDGFVDFAAAMNARASGGVTPENNAVVKLIEAYGPDLIPSEHRARYFELLGVPPPPVDGTFLLDDRQFFQHCCDGDPDSAEFISQFGEDLNVATHQPWADAQFPRLAEFLAANEAPLRLIVEATQRTRYYSPIAEPDAELSSVLLHVEQRTRWAARLLTLRAMQRLEQGDATGAWEDILACHRLARLMGQSPCLIGVIVSYALDRMAEDASQALIRSDVLTAAQARQCLDDLHELAPRTTAADLADFGQRLEIIDAHCRIATCQSSYMAETRPPEYLRPAFGNALDWSRMLQLANEKIDRWVAIMRIADPRQRVVEFDLLEQELAAARIGWQAGVCGILGLQGPMTEGMHHDLIRTLGGAVENLSEFETSATAASELSRVGFAVVLVQRERGVWPIDLAELAPGILPAVPLDPCSGRDFIYRPSGNGFVLYSVGRNNRDEDGRGRDDQPRGDDIALRVGADHR